MPKRTDLKRILVIGSGPIVIGQACEFDYSGTQACKALRAEGLEVVLVNSNPATIMTDPELADRTYVEPLTAEVARADHRARAARRAAADRRRPDRAQPRGRARRAAACSRSTASQLIGASIDGDQGRRGSAASSRTRCGRSASTCPRARYVELDRAGARGRSSASAFRSSSGRRSRSAASAAASPTTSRSSARSASAGSSLSPVHEILRRGVGDRLEGIRARGHARRRRQLRRHLLDREHRSDGRAHRRQHHRRAGADAHRQGIPADARRRAPHHPPRRRRDRRVEHPVRHQPGGRPDGRDRDEPARVAVVGARVEGHRLSRSRRSRRSSRSATASTRSPTTSRG